MGEGSRRRRSNVRLTSSILEAVVARRTVSAVQIQGTVVTSRSRKCLELTDARMYRRQRFADKALSGSKLASRR